MQIRALKNGEERAWVCLDCEDEQAEERLKPLLEYRQANQRLPADSYLVAIAEDRIVGKLRTNTEDPTTYSLSYLAVASEQDFVCIGTELLRYAKGRFTDRPLEAASWDKSEDNAWHELLFRSGFDVYIEKFYFRRGLDSYKSPYNDPFSYRSLQELGEEEFLKQSVQIYADNLNRNFNGEDPISEFFELKVAAGSTFDSKQWQVAILNGEPAGIVIPKIFDDIPEDGTIHMFGLFPQFRGKGFGKILHAKGLQDLAQSGAKRYVGSTDRNNTPMIATFKSNGCEEQGVRRQYRVKHAGDLVVEV